MLRRVAPVRTDVSEELGASFIRETKFGELETTLAVTSNRRTLQKNDKCAVKTTNLTSEPIAYRMWESRHLTTLRASAACYLDSFTFCQ
jgi:hypothetical protein